MHPYTLYRVCLLMGRICIYDLVNPWIIFIIITLPNIYFEGLFPVSILKTLHALSYLILSKPLWDRNSYCPYFTDWAVETQSSKHSLERLRMHWQWPFPMVLLQFPFLFHFLILIYSFVNSDLWFCNTPLSYRTLWEEVT